MKPKWTRFNVKLKDAIKGGSRTMARSLTRRQAWKLREKLAGANNLCAAGLIVKLVPAAA